MVKDSTSSYHAKVAEERLQAEYHKNSVIRKFRITATQEAYVMKLFRKIETEYFSPTFEDDPFRYRKYMDELKTILEGKY